MNIKDLDKTLKEYYIEQVKTKQRAEFKVLGTGQSNLDESMIEVAEGLLNMEINTNEPTKVVLRMVIDEPQVMRLFDICNFMDCS